MNVHYSEWIKFLEPLQTDNPVEHKIGQTYRRLQLEFSKLYGPPSR